MIFLRCASRPKSFFRVFVTADRKPLTVRKKIRVNRTNMFDLLVAAL